MPIITSFLLATTITGTTLTAVNRSWHKRAARRLTSESENASGVSEPIEQEIIAPKIEQEELDHYFAANSLSLGMTMSGFLFPPLMVASIPISIYTTIPTVQSAYKVWSEEKRVGSQTLESAIVVGAIATRYWLPASAIAWGYSYGRKLKHQVKHDLQTLVGDAGQTPKVWIEYDNSEIQVPINEVEAGDTIIVHENNIVPFPGRVTKGEATANVFFSALRSEEIAVTVGDMIPQLAVVLSGKIHVQVMGGGG